MSNVLTSPRVWRLKTLVFKTEPAYGTDAIPDGLLNWIEARNLSLTPMDVERADRNIEMPYMGNSGSVAISTWVKLSFDIALAPSGKAGTSPKWGPLLMACGMAETTTAGDSVAYNLVSNAFSSATAYMIIDNVLHRITGMRGEVKAKMSKGIPMLSFAFDGCYVAPVTGAAPTIDRSGWTIEEAVNSVNTTPVTIAGVPLSFSEFEWALGQTIARADNPGQREIMITGRKPTSSITVLAPALTVFDPFAMTQANTVVELATTHGTAAGKKVTTTMNVRVAGAEYAQIEGMVAYKLTLEPEPLLGNDELSLLCH